MIADHTTKYGKAFQLFDNGTLWISEHDHGKTTTQIFAAFKVNELKKFLNDKVEFNFLLDKVEV